MGQLLQYKLNDRWWWHWLPPLALLIVSVGIALLGAEAGEWLRYQRSHILHGEWWRLFTGHIVHLGWSHWWLNMAGLLLLWVLVGGALPLRHWWWFMVFSALGISLGLLCWLPGLGWYVGLSGLLHGMLLAGALQQAVQGERDAMGVVVIVLAKVAWELLHGPLPGSREAAGGEVVVQAHALGALCGLLYLPWLRLSRVLRRWSTS